MSFTVDDLVSSFSTNHIGQEAIDLATLQAQLASSLFYQPPASSASMSGQPVPRKGSVAQPCNTPTATSSPAFRFDEEMWQKSQGTAHANHPKDFDNEDMEDEQMVEDLLAAPAPGVPQRSMSQPLSPSSQHNYRFPTSPHAYTSPPTPHTIESPTQASLFTSTDPFYLAAVQSATRPAPPSFFAQAGRPAPTSPFLVNAPSQSQSRPMNRDVEARSVMAGGVFSR